MPSPSHDEPLFRVHTRHPQDPLSIWALEQYYGELNDRFHGGFEVSLSADPEVGSLIPPKGTFLVAMPAAGADGSENGKALPPHPRWSGDGPGPLGCVALKGSGGPVAEVKRLWVSPSARKLGVGRVLMQAVENKARTLGITTLRLDSNSALPEAVAFYQCLGGWKEIPRFNEDPYPDLFFEKTLL